MAVNLKFSDSVKKGSEYDFTKLKGDLQKKNVNYWGLRIDEKASEKWEDVNYHNKKLLTKYKQSLAEMKKEINAFHGAYGVKNSMTRVEAKKYLDKYALKDFKSQLDGFKLDYEGGNLGQKEYIKKIKALRKAKQVERYQALMVNIENNIRDLGSYEEELLKNGLMDTYKTGWKNIHDGMKELGLAGKTLGATPNKKQIEIALTYPWSGKMFSDNIWDDKERLIKTIDSNIMKGIIQGLNPKETGKLIEKTMNTGLYNATRVARTETMFIINKAHSDTYQEAGVEKFQFSAHLDDRVSDVCAENNLKIFKISDGVVGVNIPPLHPHCRSVILPYFDNEVLEKSEYLEKKEPPKEPKETLEEKEAKQKAKDKAEAMAEYEAKAKIKKQKEDEEEQKLKDKMKAKAEAKALKEKIEIAKSKEKNENLSEYEKYNNSIIERRKELQTIKGHSIPSVFEKNKNLPIDIDNLVDEEDFFKFYGQNLDNGYSDRNGFKKYQMKKEISDLLETQIKSLTSEEKNAIYSYSGSSYHDVRELFLLGEEKFKAEHGGFKLRTTMQMEARILNSFNKIKAEKNLITFRGLGNGEAKLFKSIKEGEYFQMDRVSSSSLDIDSAKSFMRNTSDWNEESVMLKFRINEGSPVIPMDGRLSSYESEVEVLLPRGSRYRVSKIKIIKRNNSSDIKLIELVGEKW